MGHYFSTPAGVYLIEKKHDAWLMRIKNHDSMQSHIHNFVMDVFSCCKNLDH